MPDTQRSHEALGAKLVKAADGAKTVAEYARKLADKTQEQVAQAAKVTTSTLNYAEHGAAISDAERKRIADVLRCDPDLLTEKATQENRDALVRDF